MVHLTNTLRSATFLLGTAVLMLFFFCAPMHAQTPTFKSTSSYKIANPNYSSQQIDPTTIGHQTYRSTIYTPFGSGTPSSNNPSGNSGSGGSGDSNDDDDVGIGGWTGTPSEPLPIGDTLPLFLFAAAMIAIIAIKQRKQQRLTTQTQSTNKNDTTQHMTTRKQTYQSLSQKLFLLLAFVCVAGQVSADKTIYFRPSTVCIDGGYNYKGETESDGNAAWVRSSSPRLYFVVEKTSNNQQKFHGSTETNTISPYILVPNTTTSITEKGQISRFIKVTLGDNSQFACYRTQNSTATLTTTSTLQDCVPNSKWWDGSKGYYGKAWDSKLISVNDMGDCNLIAIREGHWAGGDESSSHAKGYYFGYYLEEDAHIYFENKNGWTAPTFLRSKDIYAYTHDLTQIKGTNLWYCKLAKPTSDVESGIAYTQYAFISDRTTKCKTSVKGQVAATSGEEDPYLWKRWPHIADSNEKFTDLAYSKRNNHNFDKLKAGKNYTGIIQRDKLSGKTNLYIPGAANDAAVSKQTLNSWQDLNHTQTVIVEAGGKLNYQTTKLTGEGARDTYSATDQTGTVTFTAAYTATTILRAKPDDGYYFLGFFDGATGELLTRGEKMTDAEGGYVYRYDAPNAPRTIKARFAPHYSRKLLRVQILKLDKGFGWSLWTDITSSGNSITIKYTDIITGNPIEYTFDKHITENESDWVFPITEYLNGDNSIGYPSICIENISPNHPVMLTASNNSAEGYVFVGWWYASAGRPDNPWEIANISDYNSTEQPYFVARFAKVVQHTINVHTYNQEQNKYVLSEEGGNVEIIYRELTTAAIGGVGFQNCTTSIALTNTYPIPYNSTPTLTATPKEGYSFVGWYEGDKLVCTTATYSGVKAITDRNVTARFIKGEATTLDVRAMIHNGTELEESLTGGTFTMTHSGGIVYEHNTVGYVKNIPVSIEPVTFFATPNDGYEFIAWFNNEAGQHTDNPWIMLDPSDTGTGGKYEKSVSAVFASPNYVVKQDVKIEGPGTVTANYLLYPKKDNQNRTFNHNFSFNAWKGEYDITLTAEPLAGYEFVGWYENGSKLSESSTTLSYTATSARTITAKFKSAVNKLTVSVLNFDTKYNDFVEYEYEYNTITLKDKNGTQLATSYSSFSYEFKDATEVTLTATPESDEETGYDFIGWYQNNTLLSKEKTISLNVIGMQAISAHFAPTKCFNVRLLSPKGGTYSVKYARESLFNQEGMCYVVNTPYDKEINIYVPYDAKIAVINPKPINGYEYRGFKVFHGNNNNDGTFSIIPPSGKDKYEEVDLPAVIPNFVRTEEQVVYLDISNKDKDSDWADVTTFQCNKRNPANNIVNEKVPFTEKVDEFANIYKITIEAKKFDNIDVIGDHDTKEHTTGRLAIPSTRYNCFKLNAYQSSTGEWVDAWTTLPTQTGDYRLIYREQTVVNKNEIHIDYEFNEGDRIKNINFTNPTEGTQTDIVSLHIYNKVYKVSDDETINGVNNPEVILQQRNGTEWADVERYMVFGPLRSNNTSVIKMPHRKNTTGEKISVDQGIGNIIAEADGDDHACGVWNFVIQQTKDNEGKVTAKLLVDQTRRYEGDYYIRTTNADGQYNNYTHPGNVMKKSEYAAANSDYSHYFIRYVDINEDGTPTAQAGKHNQVKFTVATAYTEFLCKELMRNNTRFSDDAYEDDIYAIYDQNKDGLPKPNDNPKLPADATVRFGWDSKTNRLTRAYIANTTIKNNEYLVVEEGENIGAPQGNDTYFTDNSNWLYSIDLNATKNATAKVKAKMNGQYQYFMGSGSQDGYETLISGNGTNTYPIRLLYDFKDDRFTTIYRPESGTINNDVELSTPLMIERVHNDKATQIQLETNKKITTVQAGKDQYTQPAYAVMTFLESVLADASKTHHEKMFYWISFPFDVRIKDVFGLGDYGKYWIMEEYNGKQRAASGLAQNNWKYITKKSHILKKDTGYVLCLNYSQILQDQLFKSYGGSDKTLNSGKLSLYFPSYNMISSADITGEQTREVTLEQYENANTAWNHHNWHIIGVPSFADPKFVDFQKDIPFVYEYWHPGDAYAAVSINDVEFQAMHAYMVQYHGKINWQSIVNTSDGNVQPKGLAAKTDEQADKKVMLRLELQQAGSTLDKTYVQLRNDKGTKGFDMSLDLTKIINAGANIYSIVDNHEMAGNAIPKDETVLPLGVVITAAGDYTFAMPNGTEGMIVELIDYEQGTSTNLLVGDYTVNMPEGTNNTRFALRLKPDKVATSVEDITSGTNDNNVRKLLIDGVLYLQKGNNTYDAQGHAIR